MSNSKQLIKMTGEHFSSATGKELDKKKDAYVRFRWEEKKRVKKVITTVLERETIAKDAVLSKTLESYYGRNPKLCVACADEAEWPLIRFEFYNWEKSNTEKEVFAHVKCLEGQPIKAKLDTLRTLGKNPTFNIELNCLSVEKCALFSKASDFRNCAHIVLRFEEETERNEDGSVNINMNPVLHCKRAHPGQFSLESEADCFWNIQNAGVALLAKNIADQLETPEAKAQLEALKKQNPLYFEAMRKLIRENPTDFVHASAFGAILSHYIMEETPEEKTYEELWDELVNNGNDYY